MKKYICFMLIAAIFMLSMPTCAFAQDMPKQSEIIPLEDGSYILVELSEGSNVTRATTTRSKTYTRYNGADEIQWRASLSGTFTYDGRTADCTSCNCSVVIYNDIWYEISRTSWADENIAKATLEMGEKFLGVTVNRETHNISLVCDRYGNVS